MLLLFMDELRFIYITHNCCRCFADEEMLFEHASFEGFVVSVYGLFLLFTLARMNCR